MNGNDGEASPSRSNDWPVRFILDGPAWQRGYDLAMERLESRAELTNPFDPGADAFFGFEEGRRDAEKLAGAKQ